MSESTVGKARTSRDGLSLRREDGILCSWIGVCKALLC